MPQGIILAAGAASRAKTNKMLLVHQGLPLIVHAINGMRPFVSKIYIVTGFYHDEIVATINEMEGVHFIRNLHPEVGMFSSVQVGVKEISDDFFILPGDCPFVKTTTYERLLKGFCDIRVPANKDRNGHPIFIRGTLKQALLDEPPESNLKDFRNKRGFEALVVDDPNIIIDIDTLEDYKKLKEHGKE